MDAFLGVIADAGPAASIRPDAERWSILEYGAHLRDVFLSLRERILAAVIVEHPTGQPIYREERVNLGFYDGDTPEDIALELDVASGLLLKVLERLPEGAASRRMRYSPVTNLEVTVGWVAAQAAHEAEHHLGDVQANLTLS